MLVLEMTRYGKVVVLGVAYALLHCAAQAFSPLEGETMLSKGPQGFLQEYCIGCHGEEKQKGDRRFDHLDLNFDHDDTFSLIVKFRMFPSFYPASGS